MIVITYLKWTWDWWYSGYSGYFLHNLTIQLDKGLCRSFFQRYQKLRWVAHPKLHASRCIGWIESFVQCSLAEHGMTIAVQLLHFVIIIFLPILYQFQLLCKVSMWLLFDTAYIVDLWLYRLLPFFPRTMLGDVLHRIITLELCYLLQFPMGCIHRLLKSCAAANARVRATTAVYLVAILEYLTAEVLELAGNTKI